MKNSVLLFTIILTFLIQNFSFSQISSTGAIPNSKKLAGIMKKELKGLGLGYSGLELVYLHDGDFILAYAKSIADGFSNNKNKLFFGNVKEGLKRESDPIQEIDGKKFSPIYMKQIDNNLFGYFISISDTESEIIKMKLSSLDSDKWEKIKTVKKFKKKFNISPTIWYRGISAFEDKDYIILTLPSSEYKVLDVLVVDSKLNFVFETSTSIGDEKQVLSNIRRVAKETYLFDFSKHKTNEKIIFRVNKGFEKRNTPFNLTNFAKGFQNQYYISYFDQKTAVVSIKEYDSTFQETINEFRFELMDILKNFPHEKLVLKNTHFRKKGKDEEFVFTLYHWGGESTIEACFRMQEGKLYPVKRLYDYKTNLESSWQRPLKDEILKNYQGNRNDGPLMFDPQLILSQETIQSKYVPYIRKGKIELSNPLAKSKSKKIITTGVFSKTFQGVFYINNRNYLLNTPDFKSLEILEIEQ